MIRKPIQRVLIVTFPHVGRNLFCTPAIKLIRRKWPDSHITVLARSRRGAAVFTNNPGIDRVITARNRFTLRAAGRRSDYIIGFCGGSKRRAFDGLDVPLLWTGKTLDEEHRADELLHFLSENLDIPLVEEDRQYVLEPSRDDYSAASSLIPPSEGTYHVGIHLGSGRTNAHGWKFWYKARERDARLWGVPHYVDMAERLRKGHPQIRFVLTGGRNERFLAARFLKAIPDAVNVVGKTSVMELAALMTTFNLFITHDTGPLHVAAAMGTPLVSVFGASNPKLTGPYPSRERYLVIEGSTTQEISPQEIARAVERKFFS